MLPTTSYLHKNTETIKYRIYSRARSLFPTLTDDFAGILRILLAIVDVLLCPRAIQRDHTEVGVQLELARCLHAHVFRAPAEVKGEG